MRNSSLDFIKSANLPSGILGFILNDPGYAETLKSSIKSAIATCKLVNDNYRWNCPIKDHFRESILRKGFKETAFLHALQASAIVIEFAKACSSGGVALCGCAAGTSNESLERGECSDNIRYGKSVLQHFINHSRRRKSKLQLINEHNARVGLLWVRKRTRRKCKCYGFSGSCEKKICWRSTPSVGKIGFLLHKRMFRSVNVDRSTLERKGPKRNKGLSIKPSKLSLVRTTKSPDFCSDSKYTSGTKRRRCLSEKHCKILCCGRGYRRKRVKIETTCCRLRKTLSFPTSCAECIKTITVRLCK